MTPDVSWWRSGLRLDAVLDAEPLGKVASQPLNIVGPLAGEHDDDIHGVTMPGRHHTRHRRTRGLPAHLAPLGDLRRRTPHTSETQNRSPASAAVTSPTAGRHRCEPSAWEGTPNDEALP